MKGHLITCQSLEKLKDFDSKGYVGLGPFCPNSDATTRQISARLRIVWDVIADLKRVQPGDVCFLHAENLIFGPYVFKTVFFESKELPQILKSPNLRFKNWRENLVGFNYISLDGYGYIATIHKTKGCNRLGADLMEIFLRQSLGIFNGVPPRFMYGDTKKIVKPLLHHEIIQMLEITNFNENLEIDFNKDYPISGDSISLDMTNYNGHLFSEKVLEAWFMENMS